MFILFASILSIGNMSVIHSNFWAGIHVFLFHFCLKEYNLVLLQKRCEH